ncbi:Hypothetical predicted protein, partial [Olea europaea subsp. europaea]
PASSKPNPTTIPPDKPLNYHTTNTSSSHSTILYQQTASTDQKSNKTQAQKPIPTHGFTFNSGQPIITHAKTPSQAVSTHQEAQVHDPISSRNNLNQKRTDTSTKAANSELSSPISGTGVNNYGRAPPPLHSIHHGEQDAHMRPHQFISNQPIGLHTQQAGGSISSNRGQILSKLTIGSSRPKNIRMHLQFDRK